MAKILAFGGSITYGIGVWRDESYPKCLSRLLDAEVICSGV